MVWRISALGFSHSAKFLEQEQQDPRVDRMWREVLPYAWHPERPPLDVGQLLVEVGERAENYYREIWSTHEGREALLGQLAEEGLVNYKARPRSAGSGAGLVRREPHFVLMNETFRRFVLSSFRAPRWRPERIRSRVRGRDSLALPGAARRQSGLPVRHAARAVQHDRRRDHGVAAAVPAIEDGEYLRRTASVRLRKTPKSSTVVKCLKLRVCVTMLHTFDPFNLSHSN
jgi:hypothetical protein